MIISFRQTFLCLLGISLLVAGVIGGIGGYFMLKISEDITYQHENFVRPAFSVERVRSNFWKAHALLLQAALDKEEDLIERSHNRALALYRENDVLLSRYEQAESSGPQEDIFYAVMTEKRQQFHRLNARALELNLLTTTGEAIEVFNAYSNSVMLPAMIEYMTALDELNTHVLDVVSHTNLQSKNTVETAFLTIVGIIGVAVALLLVAGYYFSSGIIRAVGEETAFAGAIAEKRFDAPLDPALSARKDEFGAMARALGTMRSNLQQLIDSLHASNEAAQKADECKSIFLARMSHEIRTPLNAIIGMTHIAKKAGDQKVVHDSLSKITTASNLLLGIINDILDMSKIEAGKFELVEEDFSLETLLMNVSTVASAKVDEKGQDLFVHLAGGLACRYIGDGLRLSQVLTNILGNACKFTPAKGNIRLTAECAEKNSLFSMVRFTIEDSGIGMTEAQRDRLFTPFEQGDGGTFRQFGGTGLGLSICEKIVTLMDGDIRVESEFGKGSKFIVTVKLKNSDRCGAARPDASIDVRNTKIMIVDKAGEVRAFFTDLFRELRINAVAAGDAGTALELLRNNEDGLPFSIVFFDWETAGEEGRDFVKKIKEEFDGKVVVVLVSAAKFAEIEDKAVEAGVDRFLPKPVFPSTVINLMNEVLGAPSGAAPKPSASDGDFSGKRLLLVEDNEINREIVFAYLENTGISVDVAENGAEAVEKYLGGQPYDLICMDVHMPVMDGYTASRRIRAEENAAGRRRVPIVALTANAFKEDIARCLEAGMDDHIAKPMTAEAVMQTLRKYLG